MLILHGSLHVLMPMVLHDGSQVSGSLQNPGAVIMPPTIQDKIFGKPSFDPGFAKSLRHCGEVRRLGLFQQVSICITIYVVVVLGFVRPLISVSVKNETTESHARIDDQGGMVCGGFVFANVPVAHLVTEAG